MDLTNTKAALNLWCSKKKLKIDYDIKVDNVANNQHTFHCDVCVMIVVYDCLINLPIFFNCKQSY